MVCPEYESLPMVTAFDNLYWLIGNEEDEVAATCACGWTGPWRDMIVDARHDGRDHYISSTDPRNG